MTSSGYRAKVEGKERRLCARLESLASVYQRKTVDVTCLCLVLDPALWWHIKDEEG